MSNQKIALITGANRGIGLEFVTELSQKGYQVYCCCRDLQNCDNLIALTRRFPYLKIFQMDITSDMNIEALACELDGKPIDVLINNAGVYGDRNEEFSHLSVENILSVFTTNALGTLKVTEALIPNLCRSQEKLVVTISSKMGSIADNSSGGAYAYRASKAALNALMKSAAVDLHELGVKFLLLHPGWVKTDMGTSQATITQEESVSGMIEVIENFTGDELAPFLDYQGNAVPW